MKKTLLITIAIFFGSITYAQIEFWGTTVLGGTNGGGNIFKTNNSGDNLSSIYSFTNTSGYASSALPIMQASNGIIYGMTSTGGSNNRGTLYKFNLATSAYVKLVDFGGVDYGRRPTGYLTQASNGKLYGMTSKGGLNGSGVIFQYNATTNTFVKKFDFNNTNTGKNPLGSLLNASNGKLYGMNGQGGLNNFGIIFEYDPATDVFTKKIDFTDMGGPGPNGTMIQATNGKIYGTTYYGGAYNEGVIFEYDPTTNVYTKKIDFDEVFKGEHPVGALLQASNGKLYGITAEGGVDGKGVLFEYDIATNLFTKKMDFGGSLTGDYPAGKLIQAPNGKLYGLTAQGGANNKGVLFEYDPATNTFNIKVDFAGTNGHYPAGNLTMIDISLSIHQTNNNLNVTLLPNPNNGNFTLKINSLINTPNNYTLEIYNAMGSLVHSELLMVNSNFQKQMNFKHLSKGVYFIRLRNKNDILNSKFIVQ